MSEYVGFDSPTIPLPYRRERREKLKRSVALAIIPYALTNKLSEEKFMDAVIALTAMFERNNL